MAATHFRDPHVALSLLNREVETFLVGREVRPIRRSSEIVEANQLPRFLQQRKNVRICSRAAMSISRRKRALPTDAVSSSRKTFDGDRSAMLDVFR